MLLLCIELFLPGELYPARAMIGIASNPLATQANVKLVCKALKALDLYVVLEYWLTPSAELADYVLPVASWLERPFCYGDLEHLILSLLEKKLYFPHSLENTVVKQITKSFVELALDLVKKRIGLGKI